MRKPGEPIYLRRHMIGLAAAILVPVALLYLYERSIGPLRFTVRLAVGLAIAGVAGIALYLTCRSSAKNEP
jgi:uncharacterized membrane protein HdeD (DUF308 family)